MTSDPSEGAPRRRVLPLAGGLAAVTIAAVVYSQFNLYGKLNRDSTIYLYGGQRFVHGVPPYASIMDPKGPMSSILCGFGVAVARLFGRSEVLVVRVEFCALTILAVLGVYLLVLALWSSVIAGVVAAAVFTSFTMFALDALVGPDGHTPGIVFLIFAMWLTVRRNWYWAGFLAALAFLSWQPLFAYPVIAVLCAVVWSPGARRAAALRSVAGVATPFVVLIVYYAASGYPGAFFEGTFVFPLTGVSRRPIPFGERLGDILHGIPKFYGTSSIFLWVGLALLVALAVRSVVAAPSGRRAALTGPLVLLIMLSLVVQVGYVFYDWIGWPHAFPLLPYAALGIGGGVAFLLDRLPSPSRARQVTEALLLAGTVAITAVYAVAYYQPTDKTPLRIQQASSCVIQRSIAPGSTMWVIDDPLPLVLLRRRNPDNYAYVGSGLANWRITHKPGGFGGWTAAIKRRASVVVFDNWVVNDLPLRPRMDHWLATHGYRLGFIGDLRVYVNRAARQRMAARSIALSGARRTWPVSTTGRELRNTRCPGSVVH